MENYKEKYEALLAQFEQYKRESIKWSVEDVMWYADDQGVKPVSEQDAQIILEEMIRRHDATIGITWDVISYYIQEYKSNQ